MDDKIPDEFYVKVTPETSKILQEEAFKLGYMWGGTRNNEVLHTEEPILNFLNNVKIIYYNSKSSDITIPFTSFDEIMKYWGKAIKKDCICESRTLLFQGCICGFIKK